MNVVLRAYLSNVTFIPLCCVQIFSMTNLVIPLRAYHVYLYLYVPINAWGNALSLMVIYTMSVNKKYKREKFSTLENLHYF